MSVYKDEKELLNTDWQSKINEAVQKGDYSLAAQYEQARNQKIQNSGYGGAQQTTNKYSQYLNTNQKYSGTNYHQDAINAAQQGNWNAVTQALNARDQKTSLTGTNYGKTGVDIYNELWNQYGTKAADQISGDFTYEEAPEYYDAYQKRIDDALNQLLNRADFSYNAEEDPTYQQYKETYTREGDRAMRDTLAQAAARTGGLASTYAVTAAQQANQYYMQQLADKVPELQQLAYQMYLDDIDLQAQDLGLLQNASQDAYSRYQDTLANWRADRDFAYGTYRDDIADTRYDTEWQYQQDRDALADQRYDTEWEYQLSRDQVADSRYDQEWAYQVQQDAAAAKRAAATGGGGGSTSYGDEVIAVAASLGISPEEANALKNIGSSAYSDALIDLGVGVKDTGTGGKKTTTSSKSDDPELDMDSVLALGYGPISETRLAELVKSGVVEMYVEGGKTKFRKKAAGGNGMNSMYNLAY